MSKRYGESLQSAMGSRLRLGTSTYANGVGNSSRSSRSSSNSGNARNSYSQSMAMDGEASGTTIDANSLYNAVFRAADHAGLRQEVCSALGAAGATNEWDFALLTRASIAASLVEGGGDQDDPTAKLQAKVYSACTQGIAANNDPEELFRSGDGRLMFLWYKCKEQLKLPNCVPEQVFKAFMLDYAVLIRSPDFWSSKFEQEWMRHLLASYTRRPRLSLVSSDRPNATKVGDLQPVVPRPRPAFNRPVVEANAYYTFRAAELQLNEVRCERYDPSEHRDGKIYVNVAGRLILPPRYSRGAPCYGDNTNVFVNVYCASLPEEEEEESLHGGGTKPKRVVSRKKHVKVN